MQPSIRGGWQRTFQGLELGVDQLLVFGFAFGEENVHFVQFLLARFNRLLALLVGLFELLRFEANFFRSPVVSQLCEVGQGAAEGAFAAVLFRSEVAFEQMALQQEGALHEPTGTARGIPPGWFQWCCGAGSRRRGRERWRRACRDPRSKVGRISRRSRGAGGYGRRRPFLLRSWVRNYYVPSRGWQFVALRWTWLSWGLRLSGSCLPMEMENARLRGSQWAVFKEGWRLPLECSTAVSSDWC